MIGYRLSLQKLMSTVNVEDNETANKTRFFVHTDSR
jgi:hypothetical protein